MVLPNRAPEQHVVLPGDAADVISSKPKPWSLENGAAPRNLFHSGTLPESPARCRHLADACRDFSDKPYPTDQCCGSKLDQARDVFEVELLIIPGAIGFHRLARQRQLQPTSTTEWPRRSAAAPAARGCQARERSSGVLWRAVEHFVRQRLASSAPAVHDAYRLHIPAHRFFSLTAGAGGERALHVHVGVMHREHHARTVHRVADDRVASCLHAGHRVVHHHRPWPSTRACVTASLPSPPAHHGHVGLRVDERAQPSATTA